jgi:hypothetical protein
MPRHPSLYQWIHTVAIRFPDLARPAATVLALWAFGMVLAHCCALSAVVLHLAPLLGQSFNTVRQRLREFYKPAQAKAGRQRTQIEPASFCAPLVAWITGSWSERRVALALDVTNFADRFHVLACSITYRGCAVPIAWKVLPGNRKGAWHPHWCALLGQVAQAFGPGWQILVLTDRGLESSRLFKAIVAAGMHPLMRVKAAGKFRPTGWVRSYPLGSFAARPTQRFAGRGQAYESELECTLLACRMVGCEEPWLLLTDLDPVAAAPCWYAYRAWIEQGFKVLKSAGWDWERTRIEAPDRAERMWGALAVATLWLLEVGGAGEKCHRVVPAWPEPQERGSQRKHRLFRVGLGILLAALLCGELPSGEFTPEAWPEPQAVPQRTEKQHRRQKFKQP